MCVCGVAVCGGAGGAVCGGAARLKVCGGSLATVALIGSDDVRIIKMAEASIMTHRRKEEVGGSLKIGEAWSGDHMVYFLLGWGVL